MKANPPTSSKVNRRILVKNNAAAQKALKKATRISYAHLAPGEGLSKKESLPLASLKRDLKIEIANTSK